MTCEVLDCSEKRYKKSLFKKREIYCKRHYNLFQLSNLKRLSFEYLEHIKENNPEMYERELKEYPKECTECGTTIETSNDDAGDSGICYKCCTVFLKSRNIDKGYFMEVELCDSLWQAVKYKLKKL